MSGLGMALNGLAMRYYTNPAFKRGAFTNPDAAVRREAIDLTKRGIDALASMGGRLMTLWLGQDGFDYSFQGDYRRMWDDTIEALREVAAYNGDVDIAIEYKPNEPRSYALMPDVATTLLAIREAGNANLGVTLDFAHVLYADEMPAHAAYLVARHSRILGVHLNDGYGKRDDGLMVGSVHPVQTVELLVELERIGYDGAIYFDTFPDHSGLDPEDEARTNIAIVERFRAMAAELGKNDELAAAISRQDAAISSAYRRRASLWAEARLMIGPLVLVVGSLHHDVIVRADRMPQLDETLPGSSVDYVFGGKGGNQAVAAVLHGAPTAMAGRVGDDSSGRFMLDHLDRAGVEGSMVAVDQAMGTGMSVAIVTSGGEYGAVIVSAANLAINAAEIAMPRTAKVLLIQNEIPEATNLDIAGKAKTAGAIVVLNAAPARPAKSDLLDLVDVLIVNRVEAAAMAGQSVETHEQAVTAAQMLADSQRMSIVTLGSQGLVFSDKGSAARHLPAHKVVALSSHGAGDAFAGALAARLALGSDLIGAIGYAQAAAALHVSLPVQDRAAVTPSDVFALID